MAQEDAPKIEVSDVNTGAEALLGLLSTDKLDLPASDVDEDEPLEAEDPEAEEEALEDEEVVAEDEEFESDDDFEDDLDDEEVDEEAEAETDEFDPSQTFKVQVDGEELEVTLDEALAGYQRQQAFTRKTQELAEERKQTRQEVETLREKQLEYGQALQNAEAFVRATMPEQATWTDEQWSQLRQKNPREYANKMEALQGYQKRLQAVQQEQQQLLQDMSGTNSTLTQEKLEEEQEALIARIPEWVDEETRAQEQEQLVDYAQTTYGWTPEELGAVVDHRAVDILRKAMLYDQMQEKAPQIRKKKRKKDDSPQLKPGQPSQRKSKKSKAKKAALNRLKKTGRIDDAAAVFRGLLD